MNSETGEIKNFFPEEVPQDWTPLVVGKIITFNGLYFRIHRVNQSANQIILVGVSRQEASKEVVHG